MSVLGKEFSRGQTVNWVESEWVRIVFRPRYGNGPFRIVFTVSTDPEDPTHYGVSQYVCIARMNGDWVHDSDDDDPAVFSANWFEEKEDIKKEES